MRIATPGAFLRQQALSKLAVDFDAVFAYNSHRAQRSRDLVPPDPSGAKIRAIDGVPTDGHRRDRLGGLIHEYSIAA